jgi:hypothetical protein
MAKDSGSLLDAAEHISREIRNRFRNCYGAEAQQNPFTCLTVNSTGMRPGLAFCRDVLDRIPIRSWCSVSRN